MPTTAALLTADNDTVDRTSCATASIAPTGDRLILATIRARRSGGSPPDPGIPTCFGNGLTWTLIATDFGSFSTQGDRIAIFRASGPSPSAGAITFDFGAVTCIDASWVVAEFNGVNLTTNQGVVQGAANVDDATGVMAVALSAFASATNGTFIVAYQQASGPPTFTLKDGYTEIGHDTAGQLQIMGGFLASEDTSPSITSTNSNQRWCAVAVEIAAAGGGGIPTPIASVVNVNVILRPGQPG